MENPEDAVWNAILDSAKARFDYAEFALRLSDFDSDGIMAENVLFITIVGHAQNQSIEDIALGISTEFSLIGLGLDEAMLKQFVADRLSDLPQEIKATNQALTFFNMGLQTPGVLAQVRSILKK